MNRIVLNVLDEQKEHIVVEDNPDSSLKTWDGNLKILENPITVNDFKVYSSEELHER